ncbi:MAG: hypothetical protein GYA14_00290 [Ignavibacteria bacterium]|nr:hypothetical protein [Ignavibacteria bacterium]
MKNYFKKTFSALVLIIFLIIPGKTVAQYVPLKFIVISDIHISSDQSKDDRLKTFINDFNQGKFSDIDLLAITGDNVSSYYSDKNGGDGFDNNRTLKLMSMLKELKKPYLIALGNNDYKIDRNKDSDAPFTIDEINEIEKLWKDHAGLEPYYSMEINGYKMIVLNSMRGMYLNRRFDPDQMNWFADQMKDNLPVFLFLHHPFQSDNFKIWAKPKDLAKPESEEKYFAILSKYKSNIKGIFVGHGHMWIFDTLFNTIPIYETASFGEGSGLNYYRVSVDESGKVSVEKNSK